MTCYLARSAALIVAALTSSWSAQGDEAKSRAYPSSVYWGDTHVHTQLSGDAYVYGSRLTADDAYRFAKGERIRASGGQEVQLSRPLDFLMVADHAELLGVVNRIGAGAEAVPDNAASRQMAERLAASAPLSDVLRAGSYEAYQQASNSLAYAKGALGADFAIGEKSRKTVWQAVGSIADEHNNPGTFTTFIGYEWSGLDGGGIHRNVLFADGSQLTNQILPHSALDTDDVEDLWSFLAAYEAKYQGNVIAIPHNGNLSRGNMFSQVDFGGQPLTSGYAKRRARWEPLYEVTQIKGDGETHPVLSPTDEFADFESWPPKIWWSKSTQIDSGSYARAALKRGLDLEAALGANPFKFGMIGSTDAHTGLATADEEVYWGKMSSNEPSAYRSRDQWFYSAAGYAAVWAEDNTRSSLFAAMKRRETYATTGPRMIVRFFGGWGFETSDLSVKDLAHTGYTKGVPMGGDLAHAPPGKQLSFLISAAKDPVGANLDRVQVIKGWRDKHGKSHERVFNVAVSGNREAGEDGSVRPVGNTVDLKSASYRNSVGAAELVTVWRDPEFDPDFPAFYYLRVIEIPTPRWTAYDAKSFQIESLPEDVPMIVQERAYTSPIWFTP